MNLANYSHEPPVQCTDVLSACDTGFCVNNRQCIGVTYETIAEPSNVMECRFGPVLDATL